MEYDSNKSKKNLLIFFGELRTFEFVIPNLKKLDEVDIVISTWSESKLSNDKFQVNEELLYKILPSIKQYHITDYAKIENLGLKSNPSKMFYHWKTAINNVKNPNEYDNVILHRTDLVSNWHSILDLNTKNDTLYLHYGNYMEPYWPGPNEPNIFWVNDYYFFGKFDLVKSFINLFDKKESNSSHYDMWEVIYKNNIKIENHIFRGCLIRDDSNKSSEIFNPDYLGFLVGPGSPIEVSPFSNQNTLI